MPAASMIGGIGSAARCMLIHFTLLHPLRLFASTLGVCALFLK